MQGAASLVVRVAHDLLAFACDAGAPALASFVLPTASLGCASAEALVAALEGKKESSGSTLLHRALRSKSTAMVEGLLAWGTHTSYQWQVRFRSSLSHIKAAMPAVSVTQQLAESRSCWPVYADPQICLHAGCQACDGACMHLMCLCRLMRRTAPG